MIAILSVFVFGWVMVSDQNEAELTSLTRVDGGGLKPAADGPYLYSRWNPGVIYANGKSKATLEVWTQGKIRSIALQSNGEMAMNDSGINGDKKAGDGIWTYKGFTRSYMGTEMIPGITSSAGATLYITTGDGKTVEQQPTSIGFTEKANVKRKKAAPGVFYSKWTAFIVDKNGEYLDGKFPVCDVKCGKGNEKVFKKFYQHFPDVFDFLVLIPAVPIYRPTDLAENAPYFVQVRNNVRNIGIPIIDRGERFGSAKKLKGMIYHSFGYGAILDHEIGHNWSAWIGHAQGLLFTGYDCAYHNTYGVHYSAYSNLVGQMAAFPQLKLEDNADGTYKVTKMGDQKTKSRYSPLTLYCMGLIPPSEVPPVRILRNKDYPNYNRIPKSEFDVFTINEIMAANGGERIPAYPNTQKKFRVGFVVVIDHRPTKAEVDYFATIAKYFQSKDEGMNFDIPFYEATGGRGKLNCRMAAPKKK